jgi:uncharacterized protein (DUF1330 family)
MELYIRLNVSEQNRGVKSLSVYFIANIKIDDVKEYEKYLKGCDGVFAKYRGEYLAVDDRPVV